MVFFFTNLCRLPSFVETEQVFPIDSFEIESLEEAEEKEEKQQNQQKEDKEEKETKQAQTITESPLKQHPEGEEKEENPYRTHRK